MTFKTDPIAEQSGAVKKMAEDWPIITTLLGGTKAIRAAGTAYLPKFTKEEEDSYKRRLSELIRTVNKNKPVFLSVFPSSGWDKEQAGQIYGILDDAAIDLWGHRLYSSELKLTEV